MLVFHFWGSDAAKYTPAVWISHGLHGLSGFQIREIRVIRGLFYRLYRLQNVRIRGAPAQVSRQVVPDLIGCGFWMTIKKFFRHQNEAGCAKAALEGTVRDKCLLDRMELVARSKPFDRDDVSIVNECC